MAAVKPSSEPAVSGEKDYTDTFVGMPSPEYRGLDRPVQYGKDELRICGSNEDDDVEHPVRLTPQLEMSTRWHSGAERLRRPSTE